jgi:hypothetical protein
MEARSDETQDDTNVQLAEIYYGNSTGAWRGPKALWEEARTRPGLQDLTLQQCKHFLASQPVYTKYRPARRNYPRNHIVANGVGQIVQIDIMDMQKFRASNRYLYVLLAYDTYSKYLQGVPMFNRRPASIEKALSVLLNGPIQIWTIYWDKEGSFLSHRIQAFLADKAIHNYTTKVCAFFYFYYIESMISICTICICSPK